MWRIGSDHKPPIHHLVEHPAPAGWGCNREYLNIVGMHPWTSRTSFADSLVFWWVTLGECVHPLGWGGCQGDSSGLVGPCGRASSGRPSCKHCVHSDPRALTWAWREPLPTPSLTLVWRECTSDTIRAPKREHDTGRAGGSFGPVALGGAVRAVIMAVGQVFSRDILPHVRVAESF